MSLDAEGLKEWAAGNGLAGKSFTEIARDDKTRVAVEGYVEELNKHPGKLTIQVKLF